LWAFELTAPEGSGGKTLALRLKLDGATLAAQDLPVGVDRWAAEGEPLPHGSCSVQARAPGSTAWFGLTALLALFGLRRAKRAS
jgi:MYXO-CTERM domain-containing protein